MSPIYDIQTSLLPGPELPPGVTLTPRQRVALEHIEKHDAPTSNDELGALMHEERRSRGGRGHHRDERCPWCGDEGAQIGEALEAKGLVVYVRRDGWKRA